MANLTRDYGDLRVTMTSSYAWTWDSTGVVIPRQAATWHPSSQGNLSPLGTYAEPGLYHDISGKRATLLVGQNPNTNPPKSAVARPIDYTEIWNDRSSGGKHDLTVWRPVAPEGYASLGDVAARGYGNKPSVNLVWCVRQDYVGRGKFIGTSVWDSNQTFLKASRIKLVSWWEILPDSIGLDGAANIPVRADTFRAQASMSRPTADLANILLLPVGKSYDRFTAPMPVITPDNIPTQGDQFNFKEQCKVTLPFHCFFAATDQESLDKISDPFCNISRSGAWFVEGVWANNVVGQIDRTYRIKSGVSREKSESMTHSVGVEISASYGVGLASGSVSLNYQFTYNTSSSYTEYSEKEVTESFSVPGYYVKVLLSKHVWIKGSRSDGSVVLNQMEIIATNETYLTGCELPH